MKKQGFYFTMSKELKEDLDYNAKRLNTTKAKYICAAINYFNKMTNENCKKGDLFFMISLFNDFNK